MKYNIDNIAPESKFLFFWGHQPNKDGKITKTCFSQWWLSSFKVEKVIYKTAEHWMMAKKSRIVSGRRSLRKNSSGRFSRRSQKIRSRSEKL